VELLAEGVGVFGSGSWQCLQARTSQGGEADAFRRPALAVHRDFFALSKDLGPDVSILKTSQGGCAMLS
jgi:hypothetical protein